MRLNHANLTVPDVAQARGFFETYFGLRCVAERGRNGIAVMVDESGFIFTLNNFEKVESVQYPGAFHIGFMQDSREAVDAIFERLKAGGFTVEVGHQHRKSWDRGPEPQSLEAPSLSRSDLQG